MNSSSGAAVAVRVWDLPTRAFHWLLVLTVVALVISAHVGGDAMTWHFRLGYSAFALLGFRLAWGLVGGRWSRFASFLYAPASVQRYLRGAHQPGDHFEVGHSPTGALSVFVLLALLLLQVGTGLVADDEIANQGPLNRFVSGRLASAATWWHRGPGQWVLFGLLGLHIAAIVFYRVRKGRDLVGPMLRGDKLLPPDVPAAADTAGTRLLALVLLAAWAGVVTLVVRLGG